MFFNTHKIADSIGIISYISAAVRVISSLVMDGKRISARAIKLIQFLIMWTKIFSQNSFAVTPWKTVAIQIFVV